MNINGHSQFELFPKKSDQHSSDQSKNRGQIKDLTLSVENIIVLCIILVMTCVLFFSFGVERGRRLVLNIQAPPAAISVDLPSPEAIPEVTETIEVSAGVALPAPIEATTDSEIIQVPVERVLTEADFFTIQVASYKQDSAAQREAKRLSESGYEIFVLAKGNFSIVCVGKFSGKDEAKEFSKKLKSKYTDLLVRRF